MAIAEIAEGRPYKLACVNSPDAVSISGPLDHLADIRTRIESLGRYCVQLRVPFAFHSSQMDPIVDKFEEIAAGVTFKAPTIPAIARLIGYCVFDGQTIKASYMCQATRKTVRYTEAMDRALEMGLIDSKDTAWVDIGPHPICCSLIKTAMPSLAITVASLKRDEDNFRTLSQTLAQMHSVGVDVDWNAWYSPFENNLRLVDLPAYKWNNKNYLASVQRRVSHETETISTLRTSLVHRVVREKVWAEGAEIVARSDLMHPEFLEAASGHRMNGYNVVTSSIHADVGFTLAAHLYSLMRPKAPVPGLGMKNLRVEQNLMPGTMLTNPVMLQRIATATSYLETRNRIDALDQMANKGIANRLLRDMTYMLFSYLIDYSENYRSMQSVVLNGLEASCVVTLSSETSRRWHRRSIGAFVLNRGNGTDVRKNFFATSGWKSMRIAIPLVPGGHYRFYVRMVPQQNEPGFFQGDDHHRPNARNDVSGIFARSAQFSILSTESEAEDKGACEPFLYATPPSTISAASAPATSSASSASAPPPPTSTPSTTSKLDVSIQNSNISTPPISQPISSANPALTDETEFVAIEVDSLLSLVLSEKFAVELKLQVSSSLFIECSTIGDLKNWLAEYC
ncbi:polyketide synthase protein [Rutstroemia sp. NJR-2017a BVV2]|nr:polyketide synthase protein [Rutstroemia sp. NJR-2017a BVV2]